MTALVVLEKARELLQEPEHWTKGIYKARSGFSSPGPVEVRYCLIGACREAAGAYDRPFDYDYQSYENAVAALGGCIPESETPDDFTAASRVVSFNDAAATKHADVIDALDCAVNKAGGSTD